MAVIKSLIIAFSTYSKIPMPKIRWEEKNMKYAVCFFPLIGAVISAVWLGWLYLADNILQINDPLRNSLAVLIPVLISGGIHLDGFCDITDAFSSWQPRKKKLEILKDPHVGAFAIIGCGCYLLAYYGIMGEMYGQIALVTAFGFILSRALSALALVNFKSARPKGMLDTFAQASHKKIVSLCCIVYLALCITAMFLINYIYCIAALLAGALAFWLYHHLAYKKLGGITGDMAGWFLQICELAVPYFIVLLGQIIG